MAIEFPNIPPAIVNFFEMVNGPDFFDRNDALKISVEFMECMRKRTKDHDFSEAEIQELAAAFTGIQISVRLEREEVLYLGASLANTVIRMLEAFKGLGIGDGKKATFNHVATIRLTF